MSVSPEGVATAAAIPVGYMPRGGSPGWSITQTLTLAAGLVISAIGFAPFMIDSQSFDFNIKRFQLVPV